ncbi:hypothetical protein BDQ12DRAFT_672889 [Crucibulum laeve]|uniref:Uncharacterized protein n=1 Tax=Crucibulum laeve TaxID=68775 RepID=A0A5C3MJ36_9AGAR|nr:hypothetical protein BDQ12DRAFT_672889 [Crucibulum laeve]
MALPMLAVGAECGPSNALQGLTKRFDSDRGLQQDHFGAGRAGSSREAFRSQHAGSSTPDQDAARFFSSSGSLAPHLADAYDVSAMRGALPMSQMPAVQTPQPQQAPLAAWAADFVQQQPLQSPIAQTMSAKAGLEFQQDVHMQPHTTMVPQASMQWNSGINNFRMNSMPTFMPQMPAQAQRAIATNQVSWDKEFSAHEFKLSTPKPLTQPIEKKQEVRHQTPQEADELARTAGMLLENVKNEQNPKFQNSQFMGLMKQLRDGMMVVEGNQMVESDGRTSSASHVDVKGKGKAFDPIGNVYTSSTHNFNSMPQSGMNSTLMQPLTQQSQQAETSTVAEDETDAYFREENLNYQRYWEKAKNPIALEGVSGTAETAAWDKLQSDWDRFEANASGIKPIVNYQFQDNNPYLHGDSSRTQHHLLHTDERQSLLEGVLELEAALQRDLNNASAWYNLGVKQQENEREHKALQALQRAVELDPTHLPTWLALAISYTNDSNRQGTYDAIQEWVTRNEKYQPAVQSFRALNPESANAHLSERYSRLIQCLIEMARSDVSGNVDADIQIALAVLLNTNEDYAKAQDCFRTALAVRPEDWLLYNRVGATMANSGHAGEALQFYYRALELNPGYIRARFNLGISCINLRRYEEAAQHILDALVLQDSDGVQDKAGLNDARGVTSTALWDSLKTTCLHMQRIDLAGLCDSRNLEGFRNSF